MTTSAPTQWGSTADGAPVGVLSWLADQLPSGVILNVGAGSRAPEGARQRYVSVDLVPASIRDAFVVADGLRLPFAGESFDGALCKDVIEHTLDPIGVLREVRRVCRPGAKLVVTVPRAIPRAVWADPTHIRGFTKVAICQALDAGGWHPTAPPRRVGGFPGAGRLDFERHVMRLMQSPGFGHWFGTNWYVEAVRP